MDNKINRVVILFWISLLFGGCNNESSTVVTSSNAALEVVPVVDNVSQVKRDLAYHSNQKIKGIVENPFNLPVKLKITGEYIKAYTVAYEAFKTEEAIPEEKKQIENYEIHYREKGDFIYLFFRAKRPPEETGSDGGGSSLGSDTLYVIDKRDYKIVTRNFFR